MEATPKEKLPKKPSALSKENIILDPAVLRADIIAYLLKEFNQNNRVAGYWRLSESAYEGMEGYCRRKRVLHYWGVPEEEDPVRDMIYLRGHLSEFNMQMAIRKTYPRRIQYHPFEEGPGLIIPAEGAEGLQAGRPDFLMDRIIIVEAKSVNVDSRLDGPREGHVCQVNGYMHALAGQKKISPLGLWGFIAYSREGREFDLDTYRIDYDPELFQRCKDEVTFLNGKYKEDPRNQSGQVLYELIPEAMPKMAFPCIWSTKKYSMRCGYFPLCYPHLMNEVRKGAEIIEDPNLEAMAKEWYDKGKEAKTLKAMADAFKRQFETAAGNVQGRQVGPYYIARNGQVTFKGLNGQTEMEDE